MAAVVKIRKPPVEAKDLEYWAGRLKAIKVEQDKLAEQHTEAETMVLKLLEQSGTQSKTIRPFYGEYKLMITRVQGHMSRYDEDGIRKALGARLWNKVTKKSLDKVKLNEAIQTGEVDAAVVARFYEEVPKKPYVRLTEVHDEEE